MKEYEIQKRLEGVLKQSRYEHTIGVAYTAASMAMAYDVDVKKAYLAGLLHDCAKAYSIEEQMKLCEKYEIQLTNSMKMSPQIIHQSLGSVIATKEYGVSDKDVCNAISVHTTGKPKMTMLDKILFIADYIEPNRKEIDGLGKARNLAFHNIDQCLVHILNGTVEYLNRNEKPVDISTIETYNYYKK